MDGQPLAILDLKDHTTVQLDPMYALEERLQMLIIKLVSMQVSIFQVQMLKSCQVNGNSKLDLVQVLKWVIIFG